MLREMVQTPWAAALGWTLIHSVWEGALAALAMVAALRLTRSPRLRYATGGLALLALLAALAFTFERSLPPRLAPSPLPAVHLPLPALALSPDAGDLNVPRLPLYLPWLAPFWMAGVVAFQLRAVAGWLAARRLRRAGVCAAPAVWRARLGQLARGMAVSRPVVLLESCLAEVPVVIGYLRPAILMPVGLLAGLPAAQVESILLHELAHIRRHDYLVNLLQTVLEGLLFYHPGVWWISSVMRAEREHCCDDLVVATQGDPFGYASALAALEERRARGMQAVLASTGGSVVQRVRRLLAPAEGPRTGLTPAFLAVVLMVTMAGVIAAWPTTPPPQSPAPPRIVPRFVQTVPSPLPSALDARPILIAQAQDTVREQSGADQKQTVYRKWLNEDVAYIITDAERAAFKNLTTNDELEQFIQQFWERRDPTPGTPENEFKEEHYRRIAYANAHFASQIAGWKTDRGRIYITFGPPDEIDSHANGEATADPPNVPFEQWRYRFIEGVGSNVILQFIDRERNGEYRMDADPTLLARAANQDFQAIEKRLGGGRSGTAPAAHSGATLQAVGGNGLQLSIPLSQHGSNKVNIYVRIATLDRQTVKVFEDSPTGQLAYSRFLALNPGSYRVQIITKDLTTGDLTNDTLVLAVK